MPTLPDDQLDWHVSMRADKPAVTLPRTTVARWAEVIAAAIDASERERVDALLDLAAELEEAAGVAA